MIQQYRKNAILHYRFFANVKKNTLKGAYFYFDFLHGAAGILEKSATLIFD